MNNVKFGKKKSRYTTILGAVITMPIIAVLTFLEVIPLDPMIGWIAIAAFIIGLILMLTKFRNTKLGMDKGDENNIS
ncbi:hypothetical protein JOC54_004245 [Alkalihalobacillus xiaoxiensis]|uniref:Uncharacterized protein n=1 Tax=Shouchella xiaoxiensis TaxID=766895 RepID=A0ABS2SZJ6_9BACI|nr:hypothetical protein [Shouchella xiaoxiensis]MBM7840951.1 hypothetical protein [Shouchella xiaoxiensis]